MLHTGIPEIIGNELNYSAMNVIENAWVIQHNDSVDIHTSNNLTF